MPGETLNIICNGKSKRGISYFLKFEMPRSPA